MIDELYKLWKKSEKNKKRELELMKKRYDSLSLVERNAYEKIIKRHKVSIIWLPYTLLKLVCYSGIFIIVSSYIGGVDIELFREPFFNILGIILGLIPLSILVVLIVMLINEFNLKKLKKKLLLEEK